MAVADGLLFEKMINRCWLMRQVISEQPVVVGFWGSVLPPRVVRLFRRAISQTHQGVPLPCIGDVGLGNLVVGWLLGCFFCFWDAENRGCLLGW